MDPQRYRIENSRVANWNDGQDELYGLRLRTVEFIVTTGTRLEARNGIEWIGYRRDVTRRLAGRMDDGSQRSSGSFGRGWNREEGKQKGPLPSTCGLAAVLW
jgi:hypothetical protein